MIRKRTSEKISQIHHHSNLWRNCTNLRNLKQAHALMIINGLNSNPSTLREFIYASSVAIPSAINYAHQVFAHIPEPDLFTWNTLIRGSAQSFNPSLAINVYSQMEKRNIRPDNYTFPFVLKACTKLSWVNIGSVIHGKVVKFGFESNTYARNTLIYFHSNCGYIEIARKLFDDSAKKEIVPWSALTSGYAKRGQLDIARQLFDKMPIKDMISWNVMISGYVKQGDMKNAENLFNMVPEKDVITWNVMISGYVLNGLHKQALEIFDEMIRVGERPDEVTMISLLAACSELGALDVGEKIHRFLSETNGHDLSVSSGNALIDMYAKCGSIEKSLQVFRSIREKDVTTWNSIIVGTAFHGHSEKSINIFEEMLNTTRIKPNEITFIGVLIACSHSGKIKEGYSYFDMMRIKYDMEPNIRHYGCMVDMLGRAGLLDDAYGFVMRMDMKANAIIWRTLLGACRVHGNIELGKIANERLMEMRRDHSGDYVLMSNIYALKGEWNGAEKVRELMDNSGVKKIVANSSHVDEDQKVFMEFLFESDLTKV
ncbi:pentatricopeptide repeat-containing protein At5g15300-like [Impatiens glandulifera]|uniref:pentatricopeptide repeat-containing protein At5g15300-like n=1 Tax=Impatiens glandulifera TaxID=253017 RepID=UPI001FB08039|nr:pentatricopeptide repeat-containing protein At5g15300-like [Impatiens glandulifera]